MEQTLVLEPRSHLKKASLWLQLSCVRKVPHQQPWRGQEQGIKTSFATFFFPLLVLSGKKISTEMDLREVTLGHHTVQWACFYPLKLWLCHAVGYFLWGIGRTFHSKEQPYIRSRERALQNCIFSPLFATNSLEYRSQRLVYQVVSAAPNPNIGSGRYWSPLWHHIGRRLY